MDFRPPIEESCWSEEVEVVGRVPPSSSAVLSTRCWWFRTRRTAAGTNAWMEITSAKTTSQNASVSMTVGTLLSLLLVASRRTTDLESGTNANDL